MNEFWGQIWNDWKGIIVFLLSSFCGWFGWSLKKRFVPREEHEELANKVRMIEQKTANMPTAQEILSLSLQLTDVRGELRVFNERFNSVDQLGKRMQMQVDRMEDFLKGSK